MLDTASVVDNSTPIKLTDTVTSDRCAFHQYAAMDNHNPILHIAPRKFVLPTVRQREVNQ